MRDVDQLIRDLQGPEPPRQAPEWPAPRPRWSLALGLAAVMAAAVVGVALREPETPTLRGTPSAPLPQLDLRMVVERGGVATRIPSGNPLRVGERVLFRASAHPAARAALWMDGPTERVQVWTGRLEARARDLGGSDGLVAYRFDRPGRYAFTLSRGGPSPCDGCPTLTFEVTP